MFRGNTMNTQLTKTALFTAVALSVVACSPSGTGGLAGIGGSGYVSSGSVTGFGSVFINGVEFETDNASIAIDGSQSAETDLGVGDVCVLQGSVNVDGVTGTATTIVCNDELEGYVLDVSLTNGIGTMNVMGQIVTITADTVFDSDIRASIADLIVNDIVEVHGYSDGKGNVFATRMETKNSEEDIEVKGLVSNLKLTDMTFELGNLLVVDYSSAAEGVPNLADGLYVEVKTNDIPIGDVANGFILIASKVEIEEDGDLDVDGDEGEDIEVQGVVSNVTQTSFDFNGTTVLFASLETDDDFNLESLEDGMIITVEGHIDENGNFVVEEIEEDYASENEDEGFVTALTDTTITISVNNIDMTFTVNNETRMIDEQDQDVVPEFYFSLADIKTGDFVEIDYYTDDISGDNIANEIEREDAPS